MSNRVLEYYTDGAFSSKSEMGGWGVVCVENDDVIGKWSGLEPYSTNNRMELKAVLTALESASSIQTTNTEVVIYSDSAYIVNCFEQGWYRNWISNNWKTKDRRDVKNQDLWCPIIALYIRLHQKLNLQILKVEGHSGNKYNDMVDKMAVEERKRLEQ